MTVEGGAQPARPPRAPNIRDVARAAGVSHQTVSRVINGHPALRDSTRQRVLRAMEELRFRPNRAARALVTSESRTIGALVSSGAEYGPSASLRAVETAADEAGYVVDTAHIDHADRASVEAALDRMVAHAVEGLVILAPQARTLEVLEQLSIRIPFVTVHSLHGEDHRMSVDQLSGARLATRHLLELGHRRVVHVPGPEGWVEAAARRQGYREEMTAWGLEPVVVPAGEWTANSGYRAGLALRERGGLSAVFSGNDHIALGLVHAFVEAGLEVPGDVSVVGFGDVPEAAHFLPPLTTVRQDFPELGRWCMAVLLAELRGEQPVRPGDVEPVLVVRGSNDNEVLREPDQPRTHVRRDRWPGLPAGGGSRPAAPAPPGLAEPAGALRPGAAPGRDLPVPDRVALRVLGRDLARGAGWGRDGRWRQGPPAPGAEVSGESRVSGRRPSSRAASP